MLMPYPANTLIASPARWALWAWLAQTLHSVQEATTGGTELGIVGATIVGRFALQTSGLLGAAGRAQTATFSFQARLLDTGSLLVPLLVIVLEEGVSLIATR